MDGIEERGRVVVIGTTNLIGAIDPALRRPGRFGREIEFPVRRAKADEKSSISTNRTLNSLTP